MDRTNSWRLDLRPAAVHADLGVPLPPETRIRLFKKAVLRASRVFTHHQVAFNRAILVAMEDLVVRADQMVVDSSTQAYIERQEEISAIRFDLVEVQQQLIESQLATVHVAVEEVGASLDVTEAPRLREQVTESRPPERRTGALGVNLFGDWAATTGLAEAARRLAVGLAENGFDLSLATVHSGAPLDEERVPRVLRHLPDDRPHAIDLWMLNVNEFPVVSDELLRPAGRETYAIGLWYWELPTFPQRLIVQMNRVDEIWVATKFVQASFQRATRRPVHVVPAIVPDLTGSGRRRNDFGLMDDEMVFLFSFDVNSVVARKNPAAVIEAFARAFPVPSLSRSRLVIKVLNLDRHPDVAKWLEPAVAAVNGVLIAEDLKHAELVDLFACSDAYVSLHRSEGFGFGIAEAMALGKPVIATAYSGNLDFATSSNSCQVSYRLREITSDDHVFNEGISEVYESGAVWAEPDVGQAARWMRLLAADPALRSRIGRAAQATVRDEYSTAAAVNAVSYRLSERSSGVGR